MKGIKSLPETQICNLKSLQHDGVNLWYFKLRLFNSQFEISNIYDIAQPRYGESDKKIIVCAKPQFNANLNMLDL